MAGNYFLKKTINNILSRELSAKINKRIIFLVYSIIWRKDNKRNILSFSSSSLCSPSVDSAVNSENFVALLELYEFYEVLINFAASIQDIPRIVFKCKTNYFFRSPFEEVKSEAKTTYSETLKIL